MKRRNFLTKSALAAAGATSIASCVKSEEKSQGPYINFNNTYRWKMTTTWPPNFPVVGEGCQLMADWVKKMSGGRMEITVYGGGELIPALEGFDAVSNGAVEMNHGAAYYWTGKIPASPFFAAVPFGMNAQQMSAWIISGGGDKLWEELYEPFNIHPFLCGNTGVQMAGWFKKAIETVDDLKGLKMRIPGLGAKVLEKAGGTPVLVSGGEIYTNLERGVIDATEWIGPYHDYLMGFYNVANYYYYPGWHEPGPALEMLVNKEKLESLPTDLQEIIRTACYRTGRWMGAEFDARNGQYLKKIIDETDVTVTQFPDEVLERLKVHTKEAIIEITESDPASKKVFEAFDKFKKNVGGWMDVSERVFYDKIM
ncbi:MAG: TRAP transporter substrate-binding protein [Ekhidna sp.]|nr:TRAP transporter substrate-binding protein [Ekhidna sp.]